VLSVCGCDVDTLSIAYLDNSTEIPVSLLNRYIAWSTDRDVMFRNPPQSGQSYVFDSHKIYFYITVTVRKIRIMCALQSGM